jgi:hypothetical protein
MLSDYNFHSITIFSLVPSHIGPFPIFQNCILKNGLFTTLAAGDEANNFTEVGGSAATMSWYEIGSFWSQEVYWRIPATMTPDQLNAAATALTPPTGGVASLESDADDSSEDDREGGASSVPGHMTNDPGHVTESSSDEDDNGGEELTRAEALAALRRSKGKRSANTTSDREKGEDVCARPIKISTVKSLVSSALSFELPG